MRCKLSEVMELIGGGTPKTTISEYWNGSIPWLSVKDFNNDFRYVYSTEKTITELGLQNSSTKLLQKGDVIISARGTVGEIATIPYPMAFNQSCYGLRAKKDIVTSDFLYYLIKHNVSVLKRNTHGSVFDTITRDTFENIEVDIPSIEAQNQIAGILSAIDDKIALNSSINCNLEQQAQALFKSWFVDNNNKSKMWGKVQLADITSLISRGITPRYCESSDQIVINQKCIRNHAIDLSLARFHIPKAVNEKWLCFGDLLINSTGDGTLGRAAQIWFQPQNLTVDSHVTIVRANNSKLIYYIGLWGISHEKQIESLHIGSTGQTELPRERLRSLDIPLPDEMTLASFNEIVYPILSTIISNQQENERLASLRDTLLPKLMSGEIDVSKVEL